MCRLAAQRSQNDPVCEARILPQRQQSRRKAGECPLSPACETIAFAVQSFLRTTLLLALKGFSRTFYRHDIRWIGPVPENAWKQVRIICFLNHTSLFEWLFAGSIPFTLVRRIATSGYIPVADVTISRPLFGKFLRMLAPKFLSITREPDHTWQAVVDRIEGDSMIIIFPEGRMKRANGLDKDGKPMTVRGGISDLLRAIPDGQMLIAHSGGLHHVQIPGQKFPRLFKRIRMSFEFEEIEAYRTRLMGTGTNSEFKRAVKADLERRRDLYCGDESPATQTSNR
jgi:1-acyl-sn-glycerol-3-phosphate acyltransferase